MDPLYQGLLIGLAFVLGGFMLGLVWFAIATINGSDD
jgi:hypothetical protein